MKSFTGIFQSFSLQVENSCQQVGLFITRLCQLKRFAKNSSDDYSVNDMITLWKDKIKTYYHACVVTLIFIHVNIYQIFSSNHTSETYVNNQSVCCIRYCIINSVINALAIFLWWDFIYSRQKKTLKDTMRRTVTFLFH